MKYQPVSNYIGEELIKGSNGSLDVLSPIDGTIISQVFLSSAEDVNKAIQTAREALPSWAEMPIKERAQIFFKYKQLLEINMDELTNLVVEENGKTYSERFASG